MITQNDLDQFIGTESWYRHILTPFTYTDGVKYLAEKAGAYWLIDAILCSMRYEKQLQAEEYQDFSAWRLSVSKENNRAILTCEDGNGKRIYEQYIKYTDFPLSTASLWFENGVLLLPSEH